MFVTTTFHINDKDKFFSAYRLGQCMGSGFYGEVRKCRSKKTQLSRAVALIRKDKLDELEMKRFIHETEVMSRLDHPNILRLYERY